MPIYKNKPIVGFSFSLIQKPTASSPGEPVTTGVVTGYVTIDGGIQTTLADTPIHEGNGQWSVDISAGEMNGDIIALLFTHPDAINEGFTLITSIAPEDIPVDDPADIGAASQRPKRMRTDEGSIEERSINELIAADQYAKQQIAVDDVPWGIRQAKTRPFGTV